MPPFPYHLNNASLHDQIRVGKRASGCASCFSGPDMNLPLMRMIFSEAVSMSTPTRLPVLTITAAKSALCETEK